MPPFSSPAPSPAPEFVFTPADEDILRKLGIMLSVLITTALLLFLFLLGRIRRSVRRRNLIRNLTKISYLLVPISITYIMGVLHNESDPHVLSPVWAAILIYAYGGVVTISACDLSDNEETLRYVLRTLPLFFWTLWLGFLVLDKTMSYTSLTALICTLVFFLVLAMINTRQTLEAFYKASKSKGLPHVVDPIARYMDRIGEGPDDVTPDPRSMRGYKYIVWGNPTLGHEKNITTIEDIWKWVRAQEDEEEHEEETLEPTLLARKKDEFLAKCVCKDRLRDMCLSYALFRMLLIRFAGFPPIRDANPIHPRRLIQERLLSKEPLRVFRMIEVELDFLFDYFYTKSHVCGSFRFRDMWQQLVQIILLGFIVTFVIPLVLHGYVQFRIEYEVNQVAVQVTSAVMLVFILLESCKYIMVHFSNRKIVWLLCNGIRETASSNKWAHTTQKRIVWIWTIKSYLFSKFDVPFLCFFWPWQRKLGQYSFLESYDRVPMFACKAFSPLARIVKLPRAGQRGDYVVSLSKQVKQAIVSSLVRNHELKLSRGTDTITHYRLSSACHQSDINDASFILVWHIATSFCESLHPIQNPNDPDHDHFLVATQLSKYCAYLLNFSPEFLPDHVYTTERLFDEAVKQAKYFDMRGLKVSERCQYLITRVDINDNVVVRGALLGHQLAEEVLSAGNTNRGWRVLAEFWAELLLYLAPSDNVQVHGEYLARGGEFITHLWVLLTHAGILTRNSSS